WVDDDRRVVGVGKRALAGLNSLADRADLRFQVVQTSRIEASQFPDYDVVMRIKTVLPAVCQGQFGRNAQMQFTCSVHVTGSARLEPCGLYVRDFEDTVLEVEGSGGEVTIFKGDITQFEP